MTKKRTQPSSPYLNRRLISRHAKEERFKRRLIIGTATVLGLLVLILGWGLYDHFVLSPRKPVAIVAGATVRLDTYQKRVNYRRWDYQNYLTQLQGQRQQFAAGGDDQAFLVQYIDQQIQQAQAAMINLPTSVLDELIDDLIISQECERRGIMVSDEEVQLELEAQFGYDRNPPTATPTPITHTLTITVTPTATIAPMTLEQFEARRAEWAKAAQEGAGGFREADFRQLLDSSLYRDKLAEALKTEFPTTEEQIHARHILVETREEAESALSRLDQGEAFEDLAAELSMDESNKDTGGDLGWFPRGQMVPEFDAAAFALQPGETSEIVETQFGFHIVRIDERDADRELDEMLLTNHHAQMLEDWYAARRASPEVIRKWESNMVPTAVPSTYRR